MEKSRVPPPARKHGAAKGAGKGPGYGPGWGGPAKGAGNGSAPNDAAKARAAKLDPEARTLTALRRASREERIAALKDVLLEIAIDGETENGRISAANAYLDREEGKPVQRQVTADVEDARLVINVMTKFRPEGA